MTSLFTSLSDSAAQELRGGEKPAFAIDPSNGTGSNAGGVREPATIAGISSTVVTSTDINGNHWGWGL